MSTLHVAAFLLSIWHSTGSMTILHSLLKGWQVVFTEGLFRKEVVSGVTDIFFIMESKVFDVDDDTLRRSTIRSGSTREAT